MKIKDTAVSRAWTRARGGAGLSASRVLGAALAAITMALISSRLTSVLNSVLLVGVISIGSALAAEFYRILLQMTGHGATKIASEVVGLGDSGTHQDPDQTDDQGDDRERQEDDGGEESDGGERGSSPTKNHSGRRNPLVQLSLIFGVVSLITIGVSYAVARAQGADVHLTTVQRPVEQLTDREKQEIVDLAVQQMLSQGGIPEETTPDTGDPGETETPDQGAEQQIAELLEQIATLTETNQELSLKVEELQTAIQTEQLTTAELKEQLVELRALVDSLTPTGPSDNTGG